MPSLQDIREFNDSLVRLADEPDVIREWGEEVEALPEPEEGLDTDLSSLLADTGDLAEAEEIDDLGQSATEDVSDEVAPDFSDLLGDETGDGIDAESGVGADSPIAEESPETVADDSGQISDDEIDFSDFEALLSDEPLIEDDRIEDDRAEAVETDAVESEPTETGVEEAGPVDEDFAPDEIDGDEPLIEDDRIEDDRIEDDRIEDDLGEFAPSDDGLSDETFPEEAFPGEVTPEETTPDETISDEGFSFDDETFSFDDDTGGEPAGPEAGGDTVEEPETTDEGEGGALDLPPDEDDLFGIPEGGEEIGTDEPLPVDDEGVAGVEGDLDGIDDLGAFEFTDEEFDAETPTAPEDSSVFEEPTVPGGDEDTSAFDDVTSDSGDIDDLEELDATSIDEFSLGDFGAEFGVLGDESPPTDEDLNPAVALPEIAPGTAAVGEFQISDSDFESLQATLSNLPLNLKLEVEAIISEAKGTTDQVENLVRRLAAGESPNDIATYAGKILGKQIRIPRGYEKRTGLDFEVERQGFAYQFRENILPILRLVAIFAIALGILGLAGYHLVFRPLYGRSLYREGIALIGEDQYTLGNQTFERAREVWPSSRWFYSYAHAFISERQYTLAGEKYEQLLFGMSGEERDFFNERLNKGNYSSIVTAREPEKQGILEFARLESEVLGNYDRADRLLQLILVQDVTDYDGRLALGDNFMLWADTDPDKYEEARVAYARLMERHGQTNELLFRMLRYFVRTDNLQEVLSLKELFQQDDRLVIEPDRYAEMAGYLIDHRLLDGVEEVLFRALDTDRFIPEIHYNLARYYRLINAHGEEELALSTARRLLEGANPLTSSLRGMLVDTITRIGENYFEAERFLEAQQSFGEAIEVYEEGVRRRVLGPDPKYGRAYAHLADILYYIGRQYDDALRYLIAAEENGYDEPNLDYKQGFILYRNGQLDSALGEFREAAADPSGSTNALLWATANTYFRRSNYFAAEAYYRELLERVELQRDSIRTLLVDEDPLHQSVVEYLIRVNNNLGVTLNRLSEGTGDPDLYSTALIYLTQSIEYSENFRRDPATLIRSEAVNLAYLNQRGIIYPTPEYSLQIYNKLPEDLDDLVF